MNHLKFAPTLTAMTNFREILIKIYQQTNEFGKLHGMDLVKFEADEIVYKLEVKKEHLATPTTAHGGLIAAYMDGVLGLAALYASSENACLVSTVEFKINYLKPVRLGDILVGKGVVISNGKRIIIAQGEIFNEKTGEKVAIGTGTFNAYPYEKSGMTRDYFGI
ncbi:MAG: PaaI family thioesterase [Crocinitomicaceae bacterium]|nr:PaaI family thioesterase [Crocinitomicaceae bacterium]